MLRLSAGRGEHGDRVAHALVGERVDALDPRLRAAVMQKQERRVRKRAADLAVVCAELLDDPSIPVVSFAHARQGTDGVTFRAAWRGATSEPTASAASSGKP